MIPAISSPRIVLLSLVLGGLACRLEAQDLAPASLAGRTAVGVIVSGTGDLAAQGGFRLAFAATGSTYTLRPLSALVAASSGSYAYGRISPTGGRIVLSDAEVGATLVHALAFTSPTTATYSLSGPRGTQSGTLVLEDATAPTGSLVNLSVRAQVLNGSQVIPGLSLDVPTRVLIRAGGPALAAFGVPGTLPNPRLTVYAGASVVSSNDDWWVTPANASEVREAAAKAGAFAFSEGSRDAAVVLDLGPGNYTIVVAGDAGTAGEVLVEVYRVPR
jgi:hypothetical protein